MKKLFAFLAIAAIITSCSSDDTQTTTPTEDSTLLKKTIVTDEAGQITTTIHTYDGNKIVSIIGSDGVNANYTYTGNLITYIKFSEFANSDLPFTEQTIEYNNINQKISQITRYEDPYYVTWQKETFSYNQDGSVTVNVYNATQPSTATEDEELVFTRTETITYTENTIVNMGLNTQTFDDKNNPMKNVLGFNELVFPKLLNDHNRLTAFLENVEFSITCSYTYNENNYPESKIEISTQGSSITTTSTQYFYE